MDEDAVNTLIAEDRVYYNWERERKNYILSIRNPTRRQETWNQTFGTKQERSDDYLLGDIF